MILQEAVPIYTAASAEWLVITEYLLKCDQSFPSWKYKISEVGWIFSSF